MMAVRPWSDGTRSSSFAPAPVVGGRGRKMHACGSRMNLPDAARLGSVNRALKLLMDDVGAQWIRKALINPKSHAYRGVPQTTWQDLRSLHLIQDAKPGYITLTGQGWETGLKFADTDIAEMRKRIERIYGAIQSAMVGRSHAAAAAPASRSYRRGAICASANAAPPSIRATPATSFTSAVA